jgi:hypothetical protein
MAITTKNKTILHLDSGRQIVWQAPSQSLDTVELRHEVHYYVVREYTEVRTVLRAEIMDFFCNCWCLEIPSDNCIRHAPDYF